LFSISGRKKRAVAVEIITTLGMKYSHAGFFFDLYGPFIIVKG